MVDPVPQLEDLAVERGTRVLLRADFNVPLHDGDDRGRPAHHRRAADDRVPASTAARRSCAARTSGRPKGKFEPEILAGARRAAPRASCSASTVELSPEVAGFESVRRSQCLEAGRRHDDREPALRSGRGVERSRLRREPGRARRRLRRRRVRRRASCPRVDRRAAGRAARRPPAGCSPARSRCSAACSTPPSTRSSRSSGA